jgi:hypothetical protein
MARTARAGGSSDQCGRRALCALPKKQPLCRNRSASGDGLRRAARHQNRRWQGKGKIWPCRGTTADRAGVIFAKLFAGLLAAEFGQGQTRSLQDLDGLFAARLGQCRQTMGQASHSKAQPDENRQHQGHQSGAHLQHGAWLAEKFGLVDEICALINGTIAGREGAEEITLYRSLDVHAQDIERAAFVHAKASAQGLGTPVSL